MRLRLLVLGAAALLSSPAAGTAWGKSGFEASLDIGSRRELFVDYHLVGQLRGTRLKLHVPRPGGVAISYERPWEDWYSFYTTILKDGDTYRMYYRCGLGAQSYTCYAESRDGIRWTRPSLGLFEAQGSRENNVILDSGHQFCPFIDGRPGVPAAERYKANMEAKGELLGYASADGIRWKLVRDEAIVPRKLRNHFDSQNVMFWSEAEELYVLYCRHAVGGRRAVARSTSRDFLNWTDPVLMTYSDTGGTVPSQHLYTNQTHPYFRAPHIYVALPGRFQAGRRVLDEAQTAELGTDPDFPRDPDWRVRDISDGVLLTSRAGTTIYDFTFRESLVRPGIGLNNWDLAHQLPGAGSGPHRAGGDVLLRPAGLRSEDRSAGADGVAYGRLLVGPRSLRRGRDGHQDPPVQRQRAGDQLCHLGGRQPAGGDPGPRRESHRRFLGGRVRPAHRGPDRTGGLMEGG